MSHMNCFQKNIYMIELEMSRMSGMLKYIIRCFYYKLRMNHGSTYTEPKTLTCFFKLNYYLTAGHLYMYDFIFQFQRLADKLSVPTPQGLSIQVSRTMTRLSVTAKSLSGC